MGSCGVWREISRARVAHQAIVCRLRRIALQIICQCVLAKMPDIKYSPIITCVSNDLEFKSRFGGIRVKSKEIKVSLCVFGVYISFRKH